MRIDGDGWTFTKFQMVTAKPPTPEEIRDQQIKDGYHPEGYGGPHEVRIEQQPDGSFVTTWKSMGSCE